jgi:hypothetical protein
MVQLLVLAVLAPWQPAGLHAQGPPDVPQRLRVRLDAAGTPLLPLNFRPNTATAIQVRLHNPTPDDFRNVSVKLVQVVQDQVRVVAQSEIAKLLPREEVRLVFSGLVKDTKEIKETKETKQTKDSKETKETKETKEGADLLELAGPPFKLQVWVEPKLKGDFPPVKQDLELVIREPRDYVKARAYYDAGAAQVNVRLALDGREPLIGPPQCPVELVLGPEFAPPKKGAFKQVLTAPDGVAELHAGPIGFVLPTVRAGLVAVTVDGYPRALVYPLTLRGAGELSALEFRKRIGVRLLVPAYTRPVPKFPVRLELDGPIQGDYRVEVALDRTGSRTMFNQVAKLPGLREQRVRLGVLPTGDLRCLTEVRDWQVEFDTTRVFGKMWLRVAVFHRGRDATEYEPVEVVALNGGDNLYVPLEVDAEAKHVFARVIQDDTRPAEIAFIDVPLEWPANKALPVKIKAAWRTPDQAPIDSAVLVRGKVPPDGKLAPDALLGVAAFDAKLGYWRVTLPPQEKIGPFEFSVHMTTRAGNSAWETAVVPIREPGKYPARITGTVRYGQNPVPNAALVLLDEKGMVKGNAKSDATGAFAFERVVPGNYVISATQSFPALVGQAKVQVPEGADLVDKVAIRLLSK